MSEAYLRVERLRLPCYRRQDHGQHAGTTTVVRDAGENIFCLECECPVFFD